MITINRKIEAYLGRKPSYTTEVLIKNNEIVEWNLEETKPTTEQLDALSSQAEIIQKNKIAVANRQKEYGSIAEQLEYITENGLDAWQTKVQEIKTKYPKE